MIIKAPKICEAAPSLVMTWTSSCLAVVSMMASSQSFKSPLIASTTSSQCFQRNLNKFRRVL